MDSWSFGTNFGEINQNTQISIQENAFENYVTDIGAQYMHAVDSGHRGVAVSRVMHVYRHCNVHMCNGHRFMYTGNQAAGIRPRPEAIYLGRIRFIWL